MNNLKNEEFEFGTLYCGGKPRLFKISSDFMSFSATNFGCTITSINLPGKNQKNVDILLGCSTLEGYASSNSSFGTIVGRFANRIGGAEFELGGKKYQLDKNDGKNCLHGGFDRYEKKLWDAKKIENENGTGVEFSRFSPDGEQNFPGNLELKVLYTLNEKNELTLEYFAKTDRPTPV
jgi:aldose 1-epimerase